MALCTVAAIEDELGLSTAHAVSVARFLPEARVYLIALKDEAWYSAWKFQPPAERPRPVDATTVGPRVYAERAEALLALYFALPLLNLKLAVGGGVLAVTYTTTVEGTVQTRFATAEALDGLRRELLTQATLLVDGDVRIVYSSRGPVSADGGPIIDSVSSLGAGSSLDAI